MRVFVKKVSYIVKNATYMFLALSLAFRISNYSPMEIADRPSVSTYGGFSD